MVRNLHECVILVADGGVEDVEEAVSAAGKELCRVDGMELELWICGVSSSPGSVVLA